MKKAFIALLLLSTGLRGLPQIIIDQSDMPNPGDTLRVSISTAIPEDYTKTGMDTTWDFSALFSMNQQLDSFVSKQSTPLPYQFFFPTANLASPGGVPSFPGLPISSPFTFYEKSAGAYKNLGFAFTINTPGFPLPWTAKYDTADEYYAFPLTISSSWNSTSSVDINIPGLASYYTTRTRTNIVDGWGTVITPWGSFQTIRVKSHLIEFDSIYIDTLGTGIPIVRDITQFKWLAKGKGIPVLQINQEGQASTAIYRDFYRQPVQPLNVDLGPDTSVYKGTTITITANTSGGTPPYSFIWSTLDLTPTITVTIDTLKRFSVVVIDGNNNAGFGTKLVSLKFPPGIDERTSEPLKVNPNPSDGRFKIRLPVHTNAMTLCILTMQGDPRKEIPVEPSATGMYEFSLQDLPSGMYIIQLFDGQHWYRGKLILQSHSLMH
jgi:hypothetical protein